MQPSPVPGQPLDIVVNGVDQFVSGDGGLPSEDQVAAQRIQLFKISRDRSRVRFLTPPGSLLVLVRLCGCAILGLCHQAMIARNAKPVKRYGL